MSIGSALRALNYSDLVDELSTAVTPHAALNRRMMQ